MKYVIFVKIEQLSQKQKKQKISKNKIDDKFFYFLNSLHIFIKLIY